MKKEIRIKVWEKYNKKCAYCGEDLEYQDMQIDHIRPKYHYEYGARNEIPEYDKNDIRNLNPSCRQCNFYKGTFSLDEFRKRLATITKRIKKLFIVRLAMKYNIISFKPFDGKFYFEKYNKNKI